MTRITATHQDLERYAARWLGPRRAALLLGAVVWSSFVAWDALLHRDTPNFGALVAIRLGFGTPWILAVVAATYLPAARSERVASSLLGFGVSGVWCALLWMMLVNEPALSSSKYVPALVLVMFFHFTLSRQRWRAATAWAVLCVGMFNVAMLAIWSRHPTPDVLEHWLNADLHFVGFTALGAALAYQLEHHDHREQQDRAALHEQNLHLAEARQLEREAKRRVEQAYSERADFLVQASHDLRQPMQSMTLFVALLKAQVLTEPVAALVTGMERAARSMDDLFRSMLDLNRLDAGTVLVSRSLQYLPALVDDIVAQCEPIARDKGLTLRSREGAGHWIDTDPILLRRILRNLVMNAIQYTPQGGLLVGVRGRGPRVRVEVWDTGTGIPAARLAEVFQPYVRVRAEGVRRRGGLGLGLAIARGMASLLGATLTVRSREGRGSVFVLSLPRSGARPVTCAPATSDDSWAIDMPAAAQSLGHQLEGLTIAVVENDTDVRAGIAALLSACGATVVDAAGTEALMARLASTSSPPDLIVADVELDGDDDGWATRDRLSRDVGANVPAVFVTGSVSAGHRARASAMGVALLQKPFLPAALIDAVSAANGARQSARSQPWRKA